MQQIEKILCSIIIRSFNEEKHIGRLLDGIFEQSTTAEIEIILVDSGSTDKTVEIAKSKGVSVITIKPESFSFGRALNIGCEKAQGEILLFASAHVYPVYKNWIEKMILPFKDPKVGLVYGRQIGNEVSKYSEIQIFNRWFPNVSNYSQNHPFCNNANSSIRKRLWLEQQFDETLTGLEDLDWANKQVKKGFYVAYEADAPIVHVHEESFSKIQGRYQREAIALKTIFPQQHLNIIDFLRLLFINITADTYHALRDRKLATKFSEIVKFRTMQFWGTFKGFHQRGEINQTLRKRFYYPNQLGQKHTGHADPGERIVYQTIQN